MSEIWRLDVTGTNGNVESHLEYFCLEKALREGTGHPTLLIDAETGCDQRKAIENFLSARGEYYCCMDVNDLSMAPSLAHQEDFIESLTSFWAEHGLFIQRPIGTEESESEIWNQFLRQCSKAERAIDLYIILERFTPDNIHFNNFLWRLERHTGKWMHFILLMERSLDKEEETIPLFRQAYRITHNDFLMTMKEAKLCIENKENQIGDYDLHTVWHATGGWALPADLLLHKVKRSPSILDNVRKSTLDTILYLPEFSTLFQSVLFLHMDQLEIECLLKCSVDNHFSDESCTFLGISENTSGIAEIAGKCPYVTCLNIFEQVYSVNPVVQSFLYHSARKKYGEETIAALHCKAADYYGLRKDWKRVLSHNLLQGKIREAAYTFRFLAFEMISNHLSEGYKELVRRSPISILENDPWVQFAYAITIKYQYPDIALQYFEKALSGFWENNDVEGEILAFCQKVCLGFFSESHKSIVLNREMLMRFQTEPGVSMCDDVVIDSYRKVFLAYAHIQLAEDISEAASWLSEVQLSSVILQDRNLHLWVDYVRILYYANRPDSQQLKFFVTEALELAASEKIQPELKMYLYQTSAFIYFIKQGLYDQARSYCEEARILAQEIGADSYLVYINLIYTYALDCLRQFDIVEQVLPETEAIARNILNIRNEHLWAYYMIGQAYHYHLKEGGGQAAFYAAENAVSLSRRSNRNSYLARALLVMGSIRLQQGELDAAQACVKECLEITTSEKYFFYRVSALYQQALIRREQGTGTFPKDLREALEQANRAEIYHFNFTAPWELPSNLAAAGVGENERQYVRDLWYRNSVVMDLSRSLHGSSGEKEFRIQMFRSFHCYRRKKDLAVGISQKARYLLELLAVSNEPIGVARIIEELWPYQNQKQAMNNFYLALHQIRRALESKDFVRYEQKRCWLDKGFYTSDVADFLCWKKRGEAAQAQGDLTECAVCFDKALALYHGAFLEEEVVEGVLTAERYSIEQAVHSLCLNFGRILLQGGNARKGIEILQIASHNEFAQEEAYRLLMVSYYMLGNRAEALRTYQTLERGLLKEMDIAPHFLSRQVLEDIKNGEAPETIFKKLHWES